jgi:hypothetical protein
MMHLCLHSAQLDVILEHKVVPVDVLVHQCQQIVTLHIAPLGHWFLRDEEENRPYLSLINNGI